MMLELDLKWSIRNIARWLFTFTVLYVLAVGICSQSALGNPTTLSLQLGAGDGPDSIAPALKIVVLLTLLTLAPAMVLMMTSFTRILIVLGFVRQALGTQTMPPNQVLIGMALFLTLFTMGPVWDHVYEKAFHPYVEKKISQELAAQEAIQPIRIFMLEQTREDDLGLFFNISGEERPNSAAEIPLRVLIPAFLISELRTAFQIGFLIYIPFLIIDMVVSSILMAMGMLMLPPTVISLPFKLVLFVLVDGWSLIIEQLVRSFQIFS
jgi:flagellar biosynthesis protein FliP